MSGSKPGKKRRKVLRELAGMAYDRELDGALGELDAKFQEWRDKKICGFELNEEIHKHHNGISRQLWNKYTLDAETLVVMAVAQGVLDESELPPDTLADLRERIDMSRPMYGETADESPGVSDS
jgi:hypothetical protein